MKEEELMESGDLWHMLGKKCKSKYTPADFLDMGGRQGRESLLSGMTQLLLLFKRMTDPLQEMVVIWEEVTVKHQC